jgi:hypothetical protein
MRSSNLTMQQPLQALLTPTTSSRRIMNHYRPCHLAACALAVLQAWTTAKAAHCKQSSLSDAAANLQQQAFHAWRGWMFLQAQQQQLQQLHQQHVLRRAWQVWLQHGARLQEQHAAASAAFAGLAMRLLKQWGLQAFAEQLQEQRARHCLQQQKLLLLVGRWRCLTAEAARGERLVAARRAASVQKQLQQCFRQWWHHTAAAGRHAAAERAAALQVSWGMVANATAADGCALRHAVQCLA